MLRQVGVVLVLVVLPLSMVFPIVDTIMSTIVIGALVLLVVGWLAVQVVGEVRLNRECAHPLRRPVRADELLEGDPR